jgi:hypothetical protein
LVRWTPATTAALLPALAGGAGIWFFIASNAPDRVGIVAGVLAAPVLWMIATTLLWRRPPMSAG